MQLQSLKVLVIEDNPTDLQIVQQLLKHSGLNISCLRNAGSVLEAKAVLTELEPDIILLDLFLPDSESLETFDTINQAVPSIAIVILSGVSDSEIARKGIQSGAQDYLIKGEFDAKLLAKSISFSIERKKIQESLRKSLEMHELIALATNDIIWDWDLEKNKILHLSEAIEANFGYSFEELDDSFTWWRDKVHPEDIDVFEAKFLEIIKTTFQRAPRYQRASHEFRFKNRLGEYRQVLARMLIFHRPPEGGKAYRIIGVLQDITELKVLQNQILTDKVLSQLQINAATIQSQEKEKEELGKELHDNINQILSSCKMYIDFALKNKETRDELLPRSLSSLNTAIEELRKLSKTLVPPSLNDVSLDDAIRELVYSATKGSATSYTVDIEAPDLENIPNPVQLMIYRIVQEQLQNISKHARASVVKIRLWLEKDNLLLSVSDNGVGFQLDDKFEGIGIRNIKSRIELHHGTIKIITSPGNGCTINIAIPRQSGKKQKTRLSNSSKYT